MENRVHTVLEQDFFFVHIIYDSEEDVPEEIASFTIPLFIMGEKIDVKIATGGYVADLDTKNWVIDYERISVPEPEDTIFWSFNNIWFCILFVFILNNYVLPLIVMLILG
jgi:hypothetical protein